MFIIIINYIILLMFIVINIIGYEYFESVYIWNEMILYLINFDVFKILEIMIDG